MDDILDRPSASADDQGQQRSLADILANGYEFDFTGFFGLGFKLWSKDIGQSILYALLAGVIIFISFFTIIGPLFVWAPLTAGYFVAAEKIANGQKPEFSDYFGGFKRFGPLLGMSAIFAVIMMVYIAIIMAVAVDIDEVMHMMNGGALNQKDFFVWYFDFLGSMMMYSLFGYVVGAFFIAIWIFTVPFIMIGKLSAIEALSMSSKVVMKKFWWILLYAVTLYFMEYIGALFIYVGLLVTVPANSFLKFAAYKQIVGLGSKKQEVEAMR